jgi:hypothetical protein
VGVLKQRIMSSKPVWLATGIAAIPYALGLLTFWSTRWTWRQLHNGCIMVIAGALTLLAIGYWHLQYVGIAVVAVLLLTSLEQWYAARPELFVVWWRAQWRYHTKYRWEFKRAIRSAGLSSLDPLKPGVRARIVGVTANEHVDLVEVRMSSAQTPPMYQRRIDGIRRDLGAVGGRAVPSHRSVQNVTLWLWKTDPLKQIVRPYEHRLPPEDGDWDAWFKQGLAVARYENGDPFKIDLISVPFHWLFAGPSRSGKSGGIGALLGAGEWALHKKAWLLDAIDPARGVELTPYDEAGLFHRFVRGKLPSNLENKPLKELQDEYGDGWINLLGDEFKQDVALTIHRFYAEMCLRAGALLGKARKFTPSTVTPLRTLLVDEIATVMAIGPVDATVGGVVTKINIKQEMEEILRQGLKFGFQVIGAVQDPLKSQVEVRDLFTYFTAFGDLGQVGFDKLFGTGAYKLAGEPKIPMRLQGVAITGTNVLSLEEIEKLADEFDRTIRIRFCWETDADIKAMGERGRKARGDDGAAIHNDLPAKERVNA